MTPRRVRLAAATVLVAIVVATAGCGASTPPGELVPVLRTQLARVDRALAARDYAEAREDLDALVEQTSEARRDGRLSPEQADRIVAAITRLAADLPEPPTSVPSRATPAPPSSTGDRGSPSTGAGPGSDQRTGTEQPTGEQDRTGPENSGAPDSGPGNPTSGPFSPPAPPTTSAPASPTPS